MGVVSEPRSFVSLDAHERIWNLNSLVSEMDSVVKNLNVFSKKGRNFIIHVSEDEIYCDDEEDCEICTAGKRFAGDDDPYLAINDNKAKIEEDVKIVETEISKETETFRSAMDRIEKYREARKQEERRLDLQHKRELAEALETYLASAQQRAEAVTQATIRAEKEAKKEEELAEERVVVTSVAETWNNGQAAEERSWKYRLKKLQELEAVNQWLKSRSGKDSSSLEKRLSRLDLLETAESSVKAKTDEILRIFRDPGCPLSISIAAFAKKMVSTAWSWGNPYAGSYIIVCVTTQFPQVMDILLAEFHKTYIRTVSKHDIELDSYAYYRRIDSMMRLYGALVQTDIPGNVHGIEHGWAWLAGFLNRTTAHNRATATALNAFLQTAGFGLHRKYKSQFLKLLNVVREQFLAKLKAEWDDSFGQKIVKIDITEYLDDRMYLKVPRGRTMLMRLLSNGTKKHHYRCVRKLAKSTYQD